MTLVPVTPSPVLRLSPLAIDPPLPADPALRAALDDMIARVKFAFCTVATETAPRASGGLDKAIRQFLSSRTPRAREIYRQKAASMLGVPPTMRSAEFGRYASLDRGTYETAGFEAVAKIPRLIMPIAHATPGLSKDVDWKKLMDAYRDRQADAADLAAGAAFKKLKFGIHHVHCFEETSEWGSDEIALGGIQTFPDGTSAVIEQFMANDDFDQGDTAAVDRVFASWNIDTGPGWPHVYSVMVAMAEKDNGGFWEFLHQLWDKVAPEVKELIATGAGAAIGGKLGGVWGAVIGAAVGAIIGWIINTFDNGDDIIGTKTFVLTLTAATKSYYDWAKLTEPGGMYYLVNYVGDGGHYSMNGCFKVKTQ